MRKSLLLLSLVSSISTRVLSPEENRNRLDSCGIQGKRQKKVLDGQIVPSSEAPWLVKVNFQGSWASGSLISSRHIITDSVVIRADNLTENGCLDRDFLRIPKRIRQRITVSAQQKDYGILKAYHIGPCSFGMVLLELSSEIDNVSPICLPNSDTQVDLGEYIDLYGLDGSALTKGTTTVYSCYEVHGSALFPTPQSEISICLDSNVCPGDMGAAFVKKVDDRMVAVAIAGKGDCKTKSLHPQLEIRHFLKQICRLTGACNTTVTPPKRVSMKKPIRTSTPEAQTEIYSNPGEESIEDTEEKEEREEKTSVHHEYQYQYEYQYHIHSGSFELSIFLVFIGVLMFY